jgi:hypothetical protein
MPLEASEFQDLVRRAEGGDLDAQCLLARFYHNGDGVPRNYVEAERWYLPSVEQGNPDAQRDLGSLYLNGLGNRGEGVRLLALAARQGDGWACYELARALLRPGGQGGDAVAAYTWFCLAEAYGKAGDKEIRKLESELSREQILSAQIRAGEEFRPSATAETARRRAEEYARSLAEEYERRRAEENARSVVEEYARRHR